MKMYLTEAVDLLERIKGRRILRMVRLFCGDVNRFLQDFPKVHERGIFACSGYSLFIQFETVGWIAFAECEREISVVMWQLEELPILKEHSDSELNNVKGQRYFECSDEKYSEPYWKDFLGKRIVGMKIISLLVDRENVRSFRNERGLLLNNDCGADLIIQTSLAEKDVPGGLNVIKNHQIRTQLRDDLAVRNV